MRDDLIKHIKEQKGIEGVVIRFDDGEMLKIKGDDYLRIHRIKDDLRNERLVAAAWVHENLDDLLPELDEGDKDRIRKFTDKLGDTLYHVGIETYRHWYDIKENNVARKDFAIESPKINSVAKQAIFALWDYAQAQDFILYYQNRLKKATMSNSSYYDFKSKVFPYVNYT